MIYKTFQGQRLPALGFGTWHLRGADCVAAVRHALDVGYRHIDTAARYENEAEIGQAIRDSGIDRSEIFLSTKLRYPDLDPAQIEARTRESLARLGVDQVDLLMPHWPPGDHPVADVMRAFGRMRDMGLARHIGTSNFPTSLLTVALEVLDGAVLANQVEYHPYLRQGKLLSMQRPKDIALTAAVPLARGRINDDPVIAGIAEAHGKTPGQVTLRWLIQQDNVIAIPKSGVHARITSNFDIFDFALSSDEMDRIFAGQGNTRLVDLAWAPVWDEAG